MTNKDLIQQGNDVFAKKLKREFHLAQPYSLVDMSSTQDLIQSFEDLYKTLPDIASPANEDELVIAELKRVSLNNINDLMDEKNSAITPPEQVISQLFIKNEDIELIKDWLTSNKENVIKANKNQMEFHSKMRFSHVSEGSVELRHMMEEREMEYINKMKDILKNHFINFPGVKELLETFIITSESTERRSSADRIGQVALISARRNTYLYQGKVGILIDEFLRNFAHEILGHCLNYINTKNSNLPFFIKENFFSMTKASHESVCQYFENAIFDNWINNSEINKDLSKEEPFENIYKRHKDTQILDTYFHDFQMLGLWILSNSTMDEHSKQTEELAKYSIEPKTPAQFVNSHRNNWNRSTKLLLPRYVSELRYSVDVVNKIMPLINTSNRTRAEELMLTGSWTPDGFVEWMKLNLESKQ